MIFYGLKSISIFPVEFRVIFSTILNISFFNELALSY